jgi:uncharacterized protein YfaP (DUF2135 family)
VNLRTIEVTGGVIDESYNEGTIAVNGGEPAAIEFGYNGTFAANVSLADGDNTITVTVSDGADTASRTVNVHLTPYGMRIELTWEASRETSISDTDLDLHLIRPAAVLTITFTDC